MNLEFYRKLPIPMKIKEEYPVTESMTACKKQRDDEIKAVFEGNSDKFLLVIGPCSADKEDSVMDYVYRLAKVQEKVKENSGFDLEPEVRMIGEF